MLFCMPGEAPAVAGQVLLPGALDHDARSQNRRAEPSTEKQQPLRLQRGEALGAAPSPAPAGTTVAKTRSLFRASRLLLFRTLRYSYGFGAILGGALLFFAAPVLPAVFALDAAATASLVPLLPLAAWLMPLVRCSFYVRDENLPIFYPSANFLPSLQILLHFFPSL